MTAEELRRTICDAVAYAKKYEPEHDDLRARCFVAALTGMLLDKELSVAEMVWSVLSTELLEPAKPVVA